MLKYRIIGATPAVLARAAEELPMPTDQEWEWEQRRRKVIMREHKRVMREARTVADDIDTRAIAAALLAGLGVRD